MQSTSQDQSNQSTRGRVRHTARRRGGAPLRRRQRDPADPLPSAPHLPLEIIESILVAVPSRIPLARTYQNRAIMSAWNRAAERQVDVLRKHTLSAFNVVRPTREMLKVFVPRLANGHELILAHPDRLCTGLLLRLHLHKYVFPIAATFAAAMKHNRVDVLNWWMQTTNLPTPKLRDYPIRDLSPLQLALDAEAWDALDWLARADLGDLCHDSFSADELVRLVKSNGEREVQFAGLWFTAGFSIDGDPETVVEAVCEVGNVQLLDAWAVGHADEEEDLFRRGWMDVLCSLAIGGRGPVIPMLEWMLRHEFVMPNVAEYASRDGHVHVLDWWKEHKSPIDFLVRDAHGDDEGDEGDGPDPESPEIEPEWLSEVKEGFALDFACKNGHQQVIDWWMRNLELLPIPNSENMVVEASANGDVEFLKIWKHRYGISDRVYDCNDALVVATENAQLEALQWWLHESGLPLKYDWVHVVHTALACDGWPFMVQWWMRQDGYTLHAAECAQVINECEELFMLERWDELGRILPFDLVKSTYHAVHHGIIDVLEWWMNKSEAADALLDGKNPALADVASVGCQINCLDWIRAQCQSRNVAFASSEQALDGLVWDSLHMDGSEPCRQFAVVQWWCSSGLDLKYTEAAFKNAIYSLSSEQIKWWIGMRLPLPMPQDVDQDFFDSYDDIAWATGGPRLVYDHWFRTQLGYSAD